MSEIASSHRRRLALLAAFLGVVSAVFLLLPPRPAAAIVCNPQDGLCTESNTTYYAGPKFMKVVGSCVCGNCTGEETMYFITHLACCPCD